MRLLLRTSCLLILTGLPMASPRAQTPPGPEARALRAAWEPVLARYPEATVGIAVRDPATRTDLGWNGDRPFHAASTMKVPVMIEVYRQAQVGRLSLDDSLEVRNAFRSIVDGSPYRISDDSDDSLYLRLGEGVPVRTLARRMITHSSNLATNLLIELVTADSVQRSAERLGAERMRVLRGVEDVKAFRQGLNNTATAHDLAALLLALMQGRAVSPEADREVVDVLLDQEYASMIPAGLPADARVAHKTGWITGVHHDAAIVYPAAAPPYVLVVLTEGVGDEERSSRLGAEIARATHAVLRARSEAVD